MFNTYEDAEIPMGAWIEKGSKSWRFIEWSMNTPWFWVTFDLRDGHSTWTDTLMLYMPQDIEDLIKQHGGNLKAIDVQMVCPPNMNGTARWSMEPLEEIKSGIALETGHAVQIFKCVNGRSYIDDDAFDEVPELENQHIIFATLM